MRTIGVFDSGVGGLTVLRALRARLPAFDFLYLGDTARLPYGTKSAETVRRYAVQAASALVSRRVDALVVACNTASAVALDALEARWPSLPILGVIEPGARAAVASSRGGAIAVIGTESTIRGGAYQREIAALAPDAQVLTRACSVFVALAEEGWFDTPAAEAVARAYLDDWFPMAQDAGGEGDARARRPDTLVLGCTHFPVLRDLLARVVGADVTLVDSAVTTAEALALRLGSGPAVEGGARGALRLLATDGPERFAAVGSRFLASELDPAAVEIIDL
ncbi:MAG TPA: glutamate racemase [Pseudomonadales bacterium]|nr:glutamate racemase [Pseudomonadales bacterium]